MRSSGSSRTLTKAAQTESAPGRQEMARSIRHETIFAGMAAALFSLLSFDYCYSHKLLLLFGDAVAHLHIARRILDSLNPGIRQIGSVWLPFPHLLMVPFAAKMSWWQSGIAGAIPSMACYVLAVAGMWRLSRYWLRPAGAAAATVFFGLNPGLLYMQTTAMTEPLFLCQMVWSTLFLTAYLRALRAGDGRGAARMLTACGLVLVTAVFTRYDGWIFTCFVWMIAAQGLWKRRAWTSRAGGAFVLFTMMLVTSPLLWFAWNARQYGDWLDFMRGPYSAKAIELRTATPGSPMYPGFHNMRVAGLYFLKTAELGAAPMRLTDLLLVLTLAGLVAAVVKWRGREILPVVLLWMPAPFYAYSVAYGWVPIFIPVWWPHSFYNTRYGMEMLPAFALGLGFLVARLMYRTERRWPRYAPLVVLSALLLILADSAALVHEVPLVLREAIANSRTRIPFEEAYARELDRLPKQGTILAYMSAHVGAFQDAGIPLRRTINETDFYQWQAALQHPAQSAQWVIAEDHDAVAKAVKDHPEGLKLISIVCSTGQPCARFYQSTLAAKDGSISAKH